MDIPRKLSGNEYYYEMEETFLEELELLPPIYSAAIIMKLDMLATQIYKENRESKNFKRFGLVAGVIAKHNPLYFSVEFLNSKSMHPLFYKFEIIDVDDYLDYINLNQTIDHGNDTNPKTINKTI